MKIKILKTREDRLQASYIFYQCFCSDKKIFNIYPIKKTFHTYGAFIDHKMVGCIIVDINPLKYWKNDSNISLIEKLQPNAYIFSTYILPDYRLLGIAQKLREYIHDIYGSLITSTSPKSHICMQHINSKQGLIKILENKTKIIWFWK